MNKPIATILAALTIVVVSSCSSTTSAPADNSQRQTMPGMSDAEHAKMKKGGSMSGMKM